MNRLSNMIAFVAVADTGGFTAAAAKLGLSRAAVSKSVMQLESHLGTRLLNRTTRRVSLTEIGRVYHERCQDILRDIEEVEAIASEQADKPQGLLRVSAPTSFGRLHLYRAIPAYLIQYPEVRISLSFSDRFVDVVSEGIDVAVRIAKLQDSSLIARKIAPCRRILCASPHYLQQRGEPQVPQDLALHPCLVYSNEAKAEKWTLRGPAGSESVNVNGPLCANNGDILCAAAVEGLGITLLPTFIVGTEIRAGRLVQVLPQYTPNEISVHTVFPSRRYLSARIRTFVDFLADYFSETPAWDDF